MKNLFIILIILLSSCCAYNVDCNKETFIITVKERSYNKIYTTDGNIYKVNKRILYNMEENKTYKVVVKTNKKNKYKLITNIKQKL